MHTPKIAILMATYNGRKFLHKQLDSIIQQSYLNWVLYILDDGSKDNTWEILQSYQTRYGTEKIKIFSQENQGSTKTFLTLTCDPEIQADYYAYADQDDIWDADKIKCAVNVLNQYKNDEPALYCSTTRLIDAEDNFIGDMPPQSVSISFSSALTANVAPGNTMVFNQAARQMLMMAGIVNVFMHDWWVCLVIIGSGGKVYVDKTAHMGYRQHANNQIGINHFLIRYIKALMRVLNGEYYTIQQKNIHALKKIEKYLTRDNKNIMKYFAHSFTGKRWQRLWYLKKSQAFQHRKFKIIMYVAHTFF